MKTMTFEGTENGLPLTTGPATDARGLRLRRDSGYTMVKMWWPAPSGVFSCEQWFEIDDAIAVLEGWLS